jgi:hypothetical protein
MRNLFGLLVLLMVVQFGTGCATIVTGAGEDQAVRFASMPRGATVYVDDNPIGQTPLSARLTRKDDHHIRIEHPGYKPYQRTIESGFNEWMIGNVVIGGLIGFGVDLLSGTNPALDTNNVNARMIKDDSAYAAGAPPTGGYTTSSPPAAPAAYMNTSTTAPPPVAPARTYPAPPPPAAPAYQPPPPARPQPPQPPANTGAYKGW